MARLATRITTNWGSLSPSPSRRAGPFRLVGEVDRSGATTSACKGTTGAFPDRRSHQWRSSRATLSGTSVSSPLRAPPLRLPPSATFVGRRVDTTSRSDSLSTRAPAMARVRGSNGSTDSSEDTSPSGTGSTAATAASADNNESHGRPLLGRVLAPPPADSLVWDSRCFSGPVVVPPLQSHLLNPQPDATAAPGVQLDLNELKESGEWEGLWRMYYYGRDSDSWAKGVKALPVPIGRVGLAVSRDGVTWQRVKGPLPGGAVLDPAESDEAFDSVHVAVGDVFCVWNTADAEGDEYDDADDDPACAIDDPKSCASADATHADVAAAGAVTNSSAMPREWCMLYSGGSLKLVELPGLPGVEVQGGEIQIGAAWSADGVHFNRRAEKPLLEKGSAGEWDQYGVSWPRVVRLSGSPAAYATDVDSSGRMHVSAGDATCMGDTWLMTYHTRGQDEQGAGRYYAGAAFSRDGGKTWQRLGKVLSGGGPGSWDEQGVSVRSVVAVAGSGEAAAQASLIMLYEGCNSNNEFAIGLAMSDDGGLTWRKAIGAGPEPGGPVLKARRGEEAWDSILVGAPYVVPQADGSFWMYYVGVGKMQGEEGPRQGIGLAVSCGGDYTRWKRYGDVQED